MKNWCIVLSLVVSLYCDASSSVVSNQKNSTMLSQKEMHHQMNAFYKRLNSWKAKLSGEQEAYMHDLLHMYDEARKNYRQDDRNPRVQQRLLDCIAALDHVMDNWSSFYQQYFDVQQFHDRVVAWQKLQTSSALGRNQAALDLYAFAYNRYEQVPTNATYLANLKNHQKKILAIMQ